MTETKVTIRKKKQKKKKTISVITFRRNSVSKKKFFFTVVVGAGVVVVGAGVWKFRHYSIVIQGKQEEARSKKARKSKKQEDTRILPL